MTHDQNLVFMIVTTKRYQGHNQEEYFGEGAFVPYQKALWDLFEKPQGGIAAKVNLFKLLEYVVLFFVCWSSMLETYQSSEREDCVCSYTAAVVGS